jgi:hypothetical protein
VIGIAYVTLCGAGCCADFGANISHTSFRIILELRQFEIPDDTKTYHS